MKLFDGLHAFLWTDPAANNCNTFLIDLEKRILVDPGHVHLFGHVDDEMARLSLASDDMDLVLVTHGHPDHLEGIKTFSKNSSLTAIHEREMEFIRSMAAPHGDVLGIGNFEPDLLLQDGELQVGPLTLQVIHTPGHSPGSVCLYWPEKKTLFSGDLIFDQGVGRVDVPGGSGDQLKQSIRKVAKLDVEVLLPGHGRILSSREAVRDNFDQIERLWFGLL